MDAHGVSAIGAEQGFLLDDGAFVDRYVAADVAFESGQILEHLRLLTSEDLWRAFRPGKSTWD